MLKQPKYKKGDRVQVEYDGHFLKGTIDSVHPKPTCVIYHCSIDDARKGFFEYGSTWFEEEVKPLEEQCLSDSSSHQ